jgi:hypothetical protein
MELVRMTVLVVGWSTAAALGIEGMGLLLSCARRGNGRAMQAATRNVKAHVLMQLQFSPL